MRQRVTEVWVGLNNVKSNPSVNRTPKSYTFGLPPTLEPVRNLVLFVLTLSLFTSARAEEAGWRFVHAVGGIAIQSPEHRPSGWFLPVRVDISGLTTVTREPTTFNSALICESTKAVVEGSNIYLSVITGLTRSGLNSRCPPAKLEALPPGKYRVFYRGPNESPIFISEVSIVL